MFGQNIKDEEAGFHELKKTIKNLIPFEASKYSDTFLKRRIYSRMNANKLVDYTEYISLITKNESELKELQKNLTIHVTEFFRDESFWKFCKESFFREIINRFGKNREIILWSAGCSYGQEPISILITFLEIDPTVKNRLRIIGTDIDLEVVMKARTYEYDMNDAKGLNKEYMDKYFNIKNNGTTISLKNEYRNNIEYQKHDVLNDEPVKGANVIFCRNTVIYFSKEAKDELYRKIFNFLQPNSFFIIGKTETILSLGNKMFKIYSSHERIYET